MTEKTRCVYFKDFDLCTCNNNPDEPGECIYENGIETSTEAIKCEFYTEKKGKNIMSDNKNLIQRWGNNDKRKSFLEAYQEWGLWLETPELELKYYRYRLPDGTYIIAMEHKHHTYAGYQQGYKWDSDVYYYVQSPGEPYFSPDFKRSISSVADLLKDAKANQQKKADMEEYEIAVFDGA